MNASRRGPATSGVCSPITIRFFSRTPSRVVGSRVALSTSLGSPGAHDQVQADLSDLTKGGAGMRGDAKPMAWVVRTTRAPGVRITRELRNEEVWPHV